MEIWIFEYKSSTSPQILENPLWGCRDAWQDSTKRELASLLGPLERGDGKDLETYIVQAVALIDTPVVLSFCLYLVERHAIYITCVS